MNAKLVIAIAACVVMTLPLAACGGKSIGETEANQNITSETETVEVENVQIPNPWTECSSIEEAENNAGFSFQIPEEIEGYHIAWLQNLDEELIEAIFEPTTGTGESEEEDDTIHLRKGLGTEDISGDYNIYSESNLVNVGSYNVTMQGNDSTVSLATWTDGAYSFSVSVPQMSVENVTAIILQME